MKKVLSSVYYIDIVYCPFRETGVSEKVRFTVVWKKSGCTLLSFIIHIHQKEKLDPDPFNDRDPLVVIAAPWMQLIHVPRVNSLEFTTYGTITLTFKPIKLLK